jgi:hypothetical protein
MPLWDIVPYNQTDLSTYASAESSSSSLDMNGLANIFVKFATIIEYLFQSVSSAVTHMSTTAGQSMTASPALSGAALSSGVIMIFFVSYMMIKGFRKVISGCVFLIRRLLTRAQVSCASSWPCCSWAAAPASSCSPSRPRPFR